MAFATIAFAGDFFDKSFAYQRRIGTYTGPASYVTGGDPLTPEQLRLKEIDQLDLDNAFLNNASTHYNLVYDYVNKKIVWYVPNTATEVANATNLSTYSARFEAKGR